MNPLADYALEEVERCASDSRIRAFKLHLFNAGVDLANEEHVAGLRAFFQALGETDPPW